MVNILRAKNIKFKTPMIRINLCDYIELYIIVKWTITVDANKKNNNPFTLWRLKINNVFVDTAEDPNIAMSMHNPLEYSDNYSMTSAILLNYYRDEVNDNSNENVAGNSANNSKIIISRTLNVR